MAQNTDQLETVGGTRFGQESGVAAAAFAEAPGAAHTDGSDGVARGKEVPSEELVGFHGGKPW